MVLARSWHKSRQGEANNAKRVPASDRRNQPVERVLKLTPDRDAWKPHNELGHYREIRRGLQRSVIPMIPKVRGIPNDPALRPQPAIFGGWLAVLYYYLGIGPLALADFEQAFLHPKGCLRKLKTTFAPLPVRPTWQTFPRCFLSLLFKQFEPWYGSNRQIQERVLWDCQEATKQGALTFPPYHFRPWEKARIIQSLYVLEPCGKPLLGDRWRQSVRTVLDCLSTKFGQSDPLLRTPQRVLLTPVHGDLNANNVLVGLNHWAPFLIDFACYQSQGHMVQEPGPPRAHEMGGLPGHQALLRVAPTREFHAIQVFSFGRLFRLAAHEIELDAGLHLRKVLYRQPHGLEVGKVDKKRKGVLERHEHVAGVHVAVNGRHQDRLP